METGVLSDFYADKVANIIIENNHELNRYMIFKALGGTLTRDGNQWCANVGEWPEHNISAWGGTPFEAIAKWHTEFLTPVIPQTKQHETGNG